MTGGHRRHVSLFHGPNQKNVGTGYASFGERATAVSIARTGRNALDFHLDVQDETITYPAPAPAR